MTVRVRMAPSPTGYLHVGTARTALFNWLYARHHGGTFIVRVDDTDLERSTGEYEEEILSSFRWLGLHWDEGIGAGGPHGTYRQSDRLDRYRKLAEQLVDEGSAYYDDRSPDELEALRSQAQSEGRHPGHYIRRPGTPFRSGVIRLTIPERQTVVFDDMIRGTVSFESEALDDFVILRSDGTPTYHLASTVDDIDYEITHVARGEDLLPSTPKHIHLTRALGGEPPAYAHLPLLLGSDGKKLSKRHGATALSDYRHSGILPEAMFNYLTILGWSLDAQTTIFSREQAVAEFDLADVSRNPSAFDPDKLLWMNGEYIRALPEDEFSELARPWVEQVMGRSLVDEEWSKFEQMASEVQERTKLLTEVGGQVRFLFDEIDQYDQGAWNKVMEREEVPRVLEESLARLSNLKSWDPLSIETTLREIPEMLGIGAGKTFQPLRVAVTGSAVSPPLFESMAALGKHPTLARIEKARRELG